MDNIRKLNRGDMWPELPYEEWIDTLDTLHMWMEIIGKIKLELAPFLNQWWEVAFFITATGITTGEIPYQGEIFQIDFDFHEHTLTVNTSWKKKVALPLQPQPVAEFYKQIMSALESLGIQVKIWPVPVEVPDPIPFAEDTKHASYDREYVERWWNLLVKASIVFDQFRTSFSGKSSPIQFFWGSFDLNGTRFSGKKATPPKAAGVMEKIMRYSENEENFAFGFWPGDERFPHPAFYSYMYPEPPGAQTIPLSGGASFVNQLGDFILPYEIVRRGKNPAKSVLDFLESTYQETAKLAGWDMKSFRTEVPAIH